jgi:hypothetical protein
MLRADDQPPVTLRRRRGRCLLLILLFCSLYVALMQLNSRQSLGYESLGITDADLKATCDDKWRVPIFVATGVVSKEGFEEFNREKGSYEYLKYAVAAADVYGDRAIKVTLKNYGDGWEEFKEPLTNLKLQYGLLPSNLTVESYFKHEPDHLTVLVAFRGTHLYTDWWSNFSWLTRPIPLFFDHYADARAAFKKVREAAVMEAAGKPIHYIVAGHSLGGGLAMHIAYGYPCVSAVVFNGSPVINKFLYKHPFEKAHVALLFQRCEPLGLLRQVVGGQETNNWFFAPIQGYFGGQQLGDNYHNYEYDMFSGKEEQQKQVAKVIGKDPGCLGRLLPRVPFIDYIPFLDKEDFSSSIFRFHSMDNYTQALARFAISCEDEVANKDRKYKCEFGHEFLEARRVYCPYFGSRPYALGDDELCTCSHWPKRDQARLKAAEACIQR